MKYETGTRVKHSRAGMIGTVIEYDGKLVLVDWQDWKTAWCGAQWVEKI